MRILEVIHLRMAGDESETLAEFARTAAGDAVDPLAVRIYRHARVEGDLLIHIHRTDPKERIEASELGVRLASVLRLHGLVDHSVWIGSDGPEDL
jgi:hypothetical protein